MAAQRFVQLVSIAGLLCAANASATISSIDTTRVATGLSKPLYATSPVGDSERLFIVEQHSGDIKLFDTVNNLTMSTPFLNVGTVSTGFEQGLLGLAFHPDYQTNGRLYVNLTNTAGDTVVREYTVADPSANVATVSSSRTVITYAQPFGNHNGGWIGFGPNDGYLYISSGDGGSGNDPRGNAQDITDNKLGKILRIDVNGDDFTNDANRNYAIPNSNPFVGQTGDDEIWAYGVRNPWRASFDRQTGDFWFGDVGQGAIEEINFQPASSAGGENYGWRIFEGNSLTGLDSDPGGTVFPIFDYPHGDAAGGDSVTGGYVYRGPNADLQGKYFFGDFASGNIWTATPDGQGDFDVDLVTSLFTTDAGSIGNIASFGEDGLGNLYIIDIFGGELFKITAVPLPLPVVLMLSALLGLAPWARRRAQSAA
jgi:glucose/arabinose dehydrogenase